MNGNVAPLGTEDAMQDVEKMERLSESLCRQASRHRFVDGDKAVRLAAEVGAGHSLPLFTCEVRALKGWKLVNRLNTMDKPSFALTLRGLKAAVAHGKRLSWSASA